MFSVLALINSVQLSVADSCIYFISMGIDVFYKVRISYVSNSLYKFLTLTSLIERGF